MARWGRVDILHNNVGVGMAGGDSALANLTDDNFDNVVAINLRGTVMACKHVIPIMRAQQGGAIINISSIAAWSEYPNVAYKATKAAMIAFTQQLALQNAAYGIRANAILPGLMNTPMAVDTRARGFNKPRAEVEAERDAQVPLRRKMGTAWDVANAALFLASDEANFITGVALPVDGGRSPASADRRQAGAGRRKRAVAPRTGCRRQLQQAQQAALNCAGSSYCTQWPRRR